MLFVNIFSFIVCLNIALVYSRRLSKNARLESAITETQIRLANWNENSEENPEELGFLVEGDIAPVEKERSTLSEESARWPDGKIPYEIDDSFDEFDVDTIKDAIKTYHEVSCIRWVPHTDEHDWVRITNRGPGCWSYVGRVGGKQTLNLQTPACIQRFGTVLHEMLHVAGFVHEQSRPDRNEFVRIAFENIFPGKEGNFRRRSESQINNFGIGYDYGSVMHYSSKAFSKNGKKTIIPKAEGVQIGQRTGFSKKDIKKLNKLYNCHKHLYI